MILVLIDYFQRIGRNFLLIASTGIAAQNIGGTTIHSALRIVSDERGFRTLVFHDSDYCNTLHLIDTLIIEEISMVSGPLLTFISELFERLHKNNHPFGGINVILVGDLAQLPPVNAPHVYQSPIWKIFYPLFLRDPQRQIDDICFYNLLKKIRFGIIDEQTWNILTQKLQETTQLSEINNPLNTTYIVGYRETAENINME